MLWKKIKNWRICQKMFYFSKIYNINIYSNLRICAKNNKNLIKTNKKEFDFIKYLNIYLIKKQNIKNLYISVQIIWFNYMVSKERRNNSYFLTAIFFNIINALGKYID